MPTRHNSPVLYSGFGAGYKALAGMPIALNPDVYGYFDDFVRVDDDQTNDWTVVKDSGASVGVTADTAGGVLNLTSAATTDDDGASIQGNEIFAATAGKNIWFGVRAACNDADQTDLCFGLTVNFATNPEAMLAAAERICFQVDDGDGSILCKTESGGTETSTDSGVDLADDTYAKLEINVEGTGIVRFYINGTLVATHTTNIPTTELTVGAMSLSGSATGTRATSIDYIGAFQTR